MGGMKPALGLQALPTIGVSRSAWRSRVDFGAFLHIGSWLRPVTAYHPGQHRQAAIAIGPLAIRPADCIISCGPNLDGLRKGFSWQPAG